MADNYKAFFPQIAYRDYAAGETEVGTTPVVVAAFAVSPDADVWCMCWNSSLEEHHTPGDVLTLTVVPIIAGVDQAPLSVDVAPAQQEAVMVRNTEAGPNADSIRVELVSVGHGWGRLWIKGLVPWWVQMRPDY